jgi:KaiC/GvpD/RAD55 family RecA-like ATPase
LEVAAA